MTEAHGLTAFARAEAVVYHTYRCYAHGPELLLRFYPLLDPAPLGRKEGDRSEGPRPGRERNRAMWFGRHDKYENGGAATGNLPE